MKATGNKIEYAGYIYEDSPGVFNYYETLDDSLRWAPDVKVDISLLAGGPLGASVLPLSQRKEVAIFHNHTLGFGEANNDFSPLDLYLAQERSAHEGRELVHYLGAPDGAIRAIEHPLALPRVPFEIAIDPQKIPKSPKNSSYIGRTTRVFYYPVSRPLHD